MEQLVKLNRYKKEGYITYYETDEPVLIPTNYVEKDPHVRGVWFSTVANIDIPLMKDPERY